MATQRVELNTSDFVKINNGGVVKSSKFILQVIDNEIFIGAVSLGNNAPDEKDCYHIKDNFIYTGIDDVYVKGIYNNTAIIVDEI